MGVPLIIEWVLGGMAALFVGAILGYFAARNVNRSRLKGVRSEADTIVLTAREEAETIKKEAELKAKDDLYQKREAFNRETEQVRGELREQGTTTRQTRGQPGRETPKLAEKGTLARQPQDQAHRAPLRSRKTEQGSRDPDPPAVAETSRDLLAIHASRPSSCCWNGSRGSWREVSPPGCTGTRNSSRSQRGEGPQHPGHGHPPLRRRAHRRHHRQHRRHPQRRHEGPDHRPRRPQHPHLREVHRRRRHRRRHAGRGHRQRLRQHPPRDRQAGPDQADPGRPDSSLADRGSRRRKRRRRWRSTSSRWAGRRCWRRTSARCTRS